MNSKPNLKPKYWQYCFYTTQITYIFSSLVSGSYSRDENEDVYPERQILIHLEEWSGITIARYIIVLML